MRQWPVVIPEVQQHLEDIIASLTAHLDALDAEIARLLAERAWAASAARLQSIPGIGPVCSAWILVATVHFTTCTTADAAVGYAGLNPLDRLSGSSVRGRPSIGHGGHARLRTALYMATLAAAQHNPVINTCYTRLRAAGKPKKVARCAAARKLLRVAWAVASKEQPFDPTYAGADDRAGPTAGRCAATRGTKKERSRRRSGAPARGGVKAAAARRSRRSAAERLEAAARRCRD